MHREDLGEDASGMRDDLCIELQRTLFLLWKSMPFRQVSEKWMSLRETCDMFKSKV